MFIILRLKQIIRLNDIINATFKIINSNKKYLECPYVSSNLSLCCHFYGVYLWVWPKDNHSKDFTVKCEYRFGWPLPDMDLLLNCPSKLIWNKVSLTRRCIAVWFCSVNWLKIRMLITWTGSQTREKIDPDSI